MRYAKPLTALCSIKFAHCWLISEGIIHVFPNPIPSHEPQPLQQITWHTSAADIYTVRPGYPI
jgi:hypothetical protein